MELVELGVFKRKETDGEGLSEIAEGRREPRRKGNRNQLGGNR